MQPPFELRPQAWADLKQDVFGALAAAWREDQVLSEVGIICNITREGIDRHVKGWLEVLIADGLVELHGGEFYGLTKLGEQIATQHNQEAVVVDLWRKFQNASAISRQSGISYARVRAVIAARCLRVEARA